MNIKIIILVIVLAIPALLFGIAYAQSYDCSFGIFHILQLDSLSDCLNDRMDTIEARATSNEQRIIQLENRTSTIERSINENRTIIR